MSVARLFAATFLLAGLTAANAGAPFPGYAPDGDSIRIQEKVNKLFDKGEYERALVIYRNDLAPRGDKYAQYMVGYMYLTGKGVPESPVQALAWYRLAAERGHESFVQVRDLLTQTLDDAALEAAGERYRELAAVHGDAAIIVRLIGEDLALLRSAGQSDVALSLQASGSAGTSSAGDTLGQLGERLELRMRYLDELVATGRSAGLGPDAGIEQLRDEVAAALERIESIER